MENTHSKKIAFLDRDGVINKKAKEHCYITKKEDFIFNDGIFDVASQLQNDSFKFIIITNQRGIARGILTEEILNEIHLYMKIEFHKRGIEILDVFYCPHENNVCDCRKPKDGMLRKACEKYYIDKQESILISDSQEDIEMAKEFGIGKQYFIESDNIKSLVKI